MLELTVTQLMFDEEHNRNGVIMEIFLVYVCVDNVFIPCFSASPRI